MCIRDSTKAEESDRARVRAEATSDTLREVLDSLREAARTPEHPGESKRSSPGHVGH